MWQQPCVSRLFHVPNQLALIVGLISPQNRQKTIQTPSRWWALAIPASISNYLFAKAFPTNTSTRSTSSAISNCHLAKSFTAHREVRSARQRIKTTQSAFGRHLDAHHSRTISSFTWRAMYASLQMCFKTSGAFATRTSRSTRLTLSQRRSSHGNQCWNCRI